jgi:hypothetical protein
LCRGILVRGVRVSNPGFRFRVQGVGLRIFGVWYAGGMVQGVGCGVKGAPGFRVQVSGFRVQSLGCRVQRVQGTGFRV